MTAVSVTAASPARAGGVPVWRLAWRNLWRNPRRTWLTAGSIGFAVWLLVFGMSTQSGSFEVMIDNGARLLTGHVQVQHPDYREDPAIEHRMTDATALAAAVEEMPGVLAVLPRLQSFALISAGERSFGGQVIGVDPALEAVASSLPTMVADGRYLRTTGEAFVGEILARNLDLAVGDEVVVLGSALEGGVAAAVADVVGTFSTGQPALDRSLMQIHIDDFRGAWNLGPQDAHVLAVLIERALGGEALADELSAPGVAALDWRDLMPDAEQTIEIKRIGTQLFFVLITVIVGFSVVNTFMMVVFERTPEFGMLMALGMRHGAIVRQLALEAFWLALVGIALGLSVSALLISALAATGIPLPADAAEIMARYNMPDRMYPHFSVWSAWVAALVMLTGTQLAVLVPALRVRRLKPVEALRAPE